VRERLWPADTFVDFDHSLNTAIKKLRQALGDSAENPRFIETLARRGYRFIAPVSALPSAAGEASLEAPAAPTALVGNEVPPPQPAAAPAMSARRVRVAMLALACVSLLVLIAVVWNTRQYSSARPPSQPAAAPAVQLAVLPLTVMTTGETEKYLGLGIADAVITQLANVRTLRIRPTAAVLKYESGAPDPRIAGEELGAEHVLSGTLQKYDETYRVSLQLIRTADGVPVWGRSFHVPRADLLTIEEEVSRQVADALRVQLRAAGTGRTRPAPRNAAAYESYLQGRALLVNYSAAKLRAAIASFARAIQLEPEYALARAGLATALAWFSVRYAYQKDALSWGKRAEEEALRTLAIDHDMAEAHFAIAAAAGTVYGRFDWGKLLAEVDEAFRLDPTLDIAYASRARGLYHLGLFDAAQVAASKAIALNPDGNVETNRLLVVMSLFSGRFAEAAKGAEDLMRRSDAPVIRMCLGQATFYLGKTQGAADLLAGVRRVADSLGTAHAELGRPREAVTWLRTAADGGFPCYPWFATDPLLEPIRRDPGYQQFITELRARFETTRARYAPSS